MNIGKRLSVPSAETCNRFAGASGISSENWRLLRCVVSVEVNS